MSIIGLGLLIAIQEWDQQRPAKVKTPWYESHGRMPNSFRQQLPRLHKLQFQKDLPMSYLPEHNEGVDQR